MPDAPPLDPDADDPKLLAQVVAYYQQTLGASPDALAYLRKRGVTHPHAADHFRVGFSDRSLGLRLPTKESKAGAAIRTRLQALGLFPSTGHEHFRGSLTFPVPAADGSGRVVNVYGRKVLDGHLRKGTALHTRLSDRGVWNVEAFPGAGEVVLCGGLWDALTFWTHGYRNVTTMFGPDALTDDLLAALAEFSVCRVLTTSEAVTGKLLAAGVETFLIRLPIGLDVNAYARQVSDPADALGALVRKAEWVGRGTSTTVPVGGPAADPREVLADLLTEDEPDEGPTAGEPPTTEDPPATDEPPVRSASPVPPAPEDVPTEVREDEVVMTFGDRRYRVRGLAQNATPHQMRVNVLVGSPAGLFVDTLDLYVSKHRRSFAQQAADELGVEEPVVRKDLGRVLLKLEEVQDARRESSAGPKPALPDMTTADRDAALSLLRDPRLLDRIADDFRVVGDRATKLLGYLAAVSRKLDTPLAVVVQSTTAAGKSTLLDAVLDLTPPEDVVKFSAMTGQSLYYMGEGDLTNKVLAIAEEEGARRASYALKLLQSEGELRIASTGKDPGGRLTTREYRVSGPVGLFLTTTSITVDEELLNRCVVLTVDEGQDATAAIHQLQRHRQTLDGLVSQHRHRAAVTLHRNAQRLLRSLPVVNPHAPRLTFPTGSTRTRRDHAKYLTLIRTLTLLHQYQRPVKAAEIDGAVVEYVETGPEDIRAANELMAVALSRSLDDLPPQTRKLLGLVERFVDAGCRERGMDRADFRFTFRDVKAATAWGDTQLKLHLRRLIDGEYLLAHRDRLTRRHQLELTDDSPDPHGPPASWLVDPTHLSPLG